MPKTRRTSNIRFTGLFVRLLIVASFVPLLAVLVSSVQADELAPASHETSAATNTSAGTSHETSAATDPPPSGKGTNAVINTVPAAQLPSPVSYRTWNSALEADPNDTESEHPALNGHVHRLARQRFLVPPGLQFDDAVRRPFLYWREWANQPLPPLRVITVFMIVATVLQLILPRVTDNAQAEYRTRWLRCFGLGILFLTVGPMLAAFLARLALYMPLATAIMAIVQFVSLLGLNVSAVSLGQSVRRLIHLDLPLHSMTMDRMLNLWIGLLLLSLFMFVPAIGGMPRLGPRLIAMISAVGIGALLRSVRANRETHDDL